MAARVESPLPFIDFDKIWSDAVERYTAECAIHLPSRFFPTMPDPVIDLISDRHPGFPMSYKIPNSGERLFRDHLKDLLDLLHGYATAVWPDESEAPKAIQQFYAALVYFFDVPVEKYGIVGDWLYSMWKIFLRTKVYLDGEIELETREMLAQTLGEILYMMGFALPLIRDDKLEQKQFLIIIFENDYYQILDQMGPLILRDGKVKSTGLLIACRDSLFALRETIIDPCEDSEIRKAFFKVITKQYDYIRDIGGNLRTALLYKVARKASWDERDHGNIFAWLGAPDPSASYDILKENYTPGTGQWFLEENEYKQWKSDPASVILLNGKDGCGKTFLSYSVIEDLRQEYKDSNTAITYFYFDVYDINKTKYINLLTGLLAQLSTDYGQKCSPLVQRLYEKFDNGKEPPFVQDILSTLKDILHQFERVYVVIDGMDENPAFDEVVGLLRTISQWGWPGLHVFLTCEKTRDEYPGLKPLITHQHTITKENTDVDIKIYLHYKYHNVKPLGKWKEKGLPFLTDWMMPRYDGIFQYVMCQLQSIQNARSSINAMRLFLQEMRLPLDESYQYFFRNVHSVIEDDGLRLLPWIGFCARHIDFREFATGVEFSVDEDPPFIDSDYRLGDPEDALELFPQLLVTSPRHLYRLSHPSVRQYLTRNIVNVGKTKTATFDAAFSHCFIAKGCLAYLLQFEAEDSLKKGTIDKYPIAVYAAQFWPHHVFYGDTLANRAVQRQLKKLFVPGRPQFKNWVSLHDVDKGPQRLPIQRPLGYSPSALYYASHLGLEIIVGWLLQGGDVDVDEEDVEGMPGVDTKGDMDGSKVVDVGEEDAKKSIEGSVNEDAKMDTKEDVEDAKMNTEVDTEKDAKENTEGAKEDDKMDEEATTIHVKKDVRAIFKVDVNEPTGFYGCALQVACVNAHLGVVQMLLEQGADINMQGGFYGTALQAAAFSGSVEIVRMLLEKGADVNAQGGYYGSALRAAVRRKHTAVAQIMEKACKA
ncbi:hypothetical protein APHAL10511_000516 [Amanita phalloides]|nr:hypothetical protein APHAL10511_000516 [Amanita phalloides]